MILSTRTPPPPSPFPAHSCPRAGLPADPGSGGYPRAGAAAPWGGSPVTLTGPLMTQRDQTLARPVCCAAPRDALRNAFGCRNQSAGEELSAQREPCHCCADRDARPLVGPSGWHTGGSRGGAPPGHTVTAAPRPAAAPGGGGA